MDNLTVTYRGIAVPDTYLVHHYRLGFNHWKNGVDAALGEPVAEAAPKLRAFRDVAGDVWYEVAPGRFFLAKSRRRAEKIAEGHSGGENLRGIEGAWGPLTEVTE